MKRLFERIDRKSVLLTVVSFSILIVIVEVFFRLAILTSLVQVPVFSDPETYYPIVDNRYWVLKMRRQEVRPKLLVQAHPQFGWISHLSQGNEFDAVGTDYRTLDDITQRPLLFFGDSMVQSVSDEDAGRLPQLVGALLPEFNVLNYGVGGYGTGQIVLRFMHEYERFAPYRPKVLIGIYLDDIRRTQLAYRAGLKPRFSLQDGELVISPPAYLNHQDYIRNTGFASELLVYRASVMALKRLRGTTRKCDAVCEEVNLRVIRMAQAFIEKNNIDATFVLIYASGETRKTTHQERVLKRIFQRAGITDFIDTKDAVRIYMDRTGREPKELWVSPDDRHYNLEGNQVVAKAIAEALTIRTSPGLQTD